MPLRAYRDFVLAASRTDGRRGTSLNVSVRVFASPAGESEPLTGKLPPSLDDQLTQFYARALDVDQLTTFGATLAGVLLPGEIRELFHRSLDRLQPGEGLRLRLQLDPTLADMPWELLYLAQGPEHDVTNFLVLNPLISLARHEPLPIAQPAVQAQHPLRLVIALNNALRLAPLQLDVELTQLQEALAGIPDLAINTLDPATPQKLNDALITGADIFHFAGHGAYDDSLAGAERGAIVLTDGSGGLLPMPADQLAVNLRNRGIQLVVLDACYTGRRDHRSGWSGTAAVLAAAGIPAIVAIQDAIWDRSAITFSRSFYRALAVGQTLDEAMVAGRQAIFNLCHPLRTDPAYSPFWADWAAPVLYLRTAEALRVAPAADERPAERPPLPTVLHDDPESTQGVPASFVADLAALLQQHRLSLFVGADLPAAVAGLPDRRTLADTLAAQFHLPQGQSLAAVAQTVMNHGNRWAFTNFLLQALQPAGLRPGPFYCTLAQIVRRAHTDLIVTTAYHRLLETALQELQDVAYLSAADDATLAFAGPGQTVVLKLYGDIQNVDSLVVTEQDQNALLRGRIRPALIDEVRRTLRRSCMLFLGCDLHDPTVSALFDEVAGDRFQQRAFAVWSSLSPDEVRAYGTNRGLAIIDTDPFLLLTALLERLSTNDGVPRTSEM